MQVFADSVIDAVGERMNEKNEALVEERDNKDLYFVRWIYMVETVGESA